MDSASELVKLYANKFDLLRTGGAAPKKTSGSGASAATVKALEELKAVINGHLKVRKSKSLCVVHKQLSRKQMAPTVLKV